jgi:hypothetical protein
MAPLGRAATRQAAAWAAALTAGKIAAPLAGAGPLGLVALIVVTGAAGIAGYIAGDQVAQSVGWDPDPVREALEAPSIPVGHYSEFKPPLGYEILMARQGSFFRLPGDPPEGRRP